MFKKMNISRKLVIFMLLIGIIPLLTGIIIAEIMVSDQLEDEIFEKLEAVQKIKHAQLGHYVNGLKQASEFISATEIVRNRFTILKQYHDQMQIKSNEPFPVNTPEYENIWNRISPKLLESQKAYNLYDIFIICAAHGHVMYTKSKENGLGANLGYDRKLSDCGLARGWKKTVEKKRTVLEDFAYYEPSGEPASFISTPFFDNDGKLLGVLAIQVPLKEINAVMNESQGMGTTGETYCVGEDFRMRSDSRIDKSGNHSVAESFKGTIKANGADTEAVKKALSGISDRGVFTDFNGNTVLSVFSRLEFGDFNWAVMAEQYKSEALKPAKTLRDTLIILLFVLAILVGLFGFFLARNISNPINDMVKRTKDLAEGEADLSRRIELNRRDELGELSGHFNRFIERIQKLIAQVKSNADTVSSASLEISSSTEEMAATIEEQSTQNQGVSSAVAQLTATSDDISRSVESTRSAAENASKMTKDGGVIIRKAMESLDAIQTQTGNLGNIIGKLGNSTQKNRQYYRCH
jgi:methyl-accepting chemotaxis protein